MAFESLELLQSIGGDPDPTASVLARAAAVERMQEAAEERESEAKRARSIERAEVLALQNRMLGDPLGRLRSERLQASELADQAADLEAQLAKVKDRLAANQERQRSLAD